MIAQCRHSREEAGVHSRSGDICSTEPYPEKYYTAKYYCVTLRHHDGKKDNKQILRETSDHKVPLDIDCGELYTPNNCYGWGTVELIGAISRSQDLSSTELDGVSGIQTQTNETFTASMEYTMTEYTNRGKDGGTIQNFVTGSQIPDQIKIVATVSYTHLRAHET